MHSLLVVVQNTVFAKRVPDSTALMVEKQDSRDHGLTGEIDTWNVIQNTLLLKQALGSTVLMLIVGNVCNSQPLKLKKSVRLPGTESTPYV